MDMAHALFDLRPWLETPAFRQLVLHLVGWRDDESNNQQAADRAIEGYKTKGNRLVFGYKEQGHLLGMIGLEVTVPGQGIIQHIVVKPAGRNRGLGKALIEQSIARLGLDYLEAETDKGSVGFYERCGFWVKSLGEKYPNTERFLCIWANE